jgi:hypothetical protein
VITPHAFTTSAPCRSLICYFSGCHGNILLFYYCPSAALLSGMLCCSCFAIELSSNFATITSSLYMARTNTLARFFHALVCSLFQSLPVDGVEKSLAFLNKYTASRRILQHSIHAPTTIKLDFLEATHCQPLLSSPFKTPVVIADLDWRKVSQILHDQFMRGIGHRDS